MEHEIVTPQLNKEQLRGLVNELPQLLVSLRADQLTVEVGWGSNLPTAELWTPTEITATHLPDFIAARELNRTFTLGESDLVLRCPNLACTICHESDLHFVSGNETVLRAVTKWILSVGFSPLWSIYSIEGKREWLEIATRPSLP